ncbi:MAG: 4Fe-4S dicluster domain-containing protein [Asgard group archaeon]|nr:4Fe-4S dicluster domain-containing protein [Asgard group archaeon]
MKCALFYFSLSGNTKLACHYIKRNVKNIKIELFDMIRTKELPNLDAFDIVGFATFTDFFSPSLKVEEFIKMFPKQQGKLAFLLNTFGNLTGSTLKFFRRLVVTRGFKVVTGFSLKTPQSYIPRRAIDKGNDHEPNKERMGQFNEFIKNLDEIAILYNKGKEIKREILSMGFFMRCLPKIPRVISRRDMGDKFVDEELCTECGKCEKGCPYNAIELNPKPQFDMTKCYGCWYCYNHCPEKAIYTKKFRNIGHYPKPSIEYSKKMKS